eukprot:4111963-Alexandrium_andersonii.AAC.1
MEGTEGRTRQESFTLTRKGSGRWSWPGSGLQGARAIARAVSTRSLLRECTHAARRAHPTRDPPRRRFAGPLGGKAWGAAAPLQLALGGHCLKLPRRARVKLCAWGLRSLTHFLKRSSLAPL